MTLSITGETRLLAVLGKPVRHSVSPLMHNTAFQALELPCAYLAFEADESTLPEVVRGLKALDVLGFNLTMPNKHAVIPLLDALSREAQLIGAVNTVRNEGGRLTGYNTDGQGFVMSLEDAGLSVSGQKFVLLGAGGAARSIALQLALDGAAEVVVFNRSPEPAKALCDVMQQHIPGCRTACRPLDAPLLQRELLEASVLVNTTNIGMGAHEGESLITDPALFHRDLAVADIIYAPPRTRLLQLAEEAGCQTLNGLGMILGQGALAFHIWTGRQMPLDAVRKAMGI